MLSVTRSGLNLSLNENTGALSITSKDIYFGQIPCREGLCVSDAVADGGAISFRIADASSGVSAHVKFEIFPSLIPYAQLTISSDSTFETVLRYPPAFDAYPDDLMLYPFGSGVAFQAGDSDALVPDYEVFHDCMLATMSFWGIVRENADSPWLLCAVMTSDDAAIENTRDGGILRTQPVWEPQKGQFGYDRVICFCVGTGGITPLCRTYREFAKERGFLVTLREKAEKNKNIPKFLGSANVWLWNDDAMDKLYSPSAVYRVPSPEQLETRKRIAWEMKSAGLDRVLWSLFDENIDKDTISYIKSLGYLTTVYDVYTDVIPKPTAHLIPETRLRRCKNRMSYWPDGIVKQKDGSLATAWQLRGIDGEYHWQNYLCDVAAMPCAMEHIPAQTEEYSLDGRFIDVIYGTLHECWDERHPTVRSDSLLYKNKLMDFIGDRGLICGTEVGCESGAAHYCYNEGLPSPSLYRAFDAGRRMTHLYYGDAIDVNLTKYMLSPKYRVPLWELVYHDCVVSYWYWGDSSNCCPELMKRRDLFALLYGMPPIFSFRASDWEKLRDDIAASYQRTAGPARENAMAEMLSFEYLTEDKAVQKTVFSSGNTIISNFSEMPFVYSGCTVLPCDYLIIKENCGCIL